MGMASKVVEGIDQDAKLCSSTSSTVRDSAAVRGSATVRGSAAVTGSATVTSRCNGLGHHD